MADTTLEVGTPAPGFTLPDQDERPVSLAQLRGSWVVLYFYPRDNTSGCTTEACEMTERLDAFGRLDAVVLGCSPDPPEKHRGFITRHSLGVRLLSDPEHETMETYGAWGEKTMYGRTTTGVIRSTVIIDPQGRVAHHFERVRAKGHAAKVEAKLGELRSSSR